MAGFLRKKATIDKKNAGVGAKQAQPQPPPPKVAELPPSLPPLFARFATKNTLEPGSPFDPWSSKISLPTSLGKLSQEPDLSLTSADQTSDGWNEWRVYSAQNTFNGMVVPDQTPVEPRSHGTAGLSNYSTGTTAPHPRQKPAIPAPAPSNHPLHSFQEKPTHTGPGSTLAPSTDVSSKPPHSTSVRPSVVSSRSPVLEVSSRQAREESPSHPIVPSKTLSSRTVQPVVPSAKPSVPVYRSLPSNPAARLPKAAATVPESPGSTFSTSTLTASHVPSFSSAATRHQLPSPPTSQDLAHTHTPRSPEKNHGASPAQNITRQVQPGTYSSLGSSTTHTNSSFTDATRRTSTFVTAHSASSIPATKQIDVINLDGQARPSSATRPAHSHPPSSTPRSISANVSSNVTVGRPLSSSAQRASLAVPAPAIEPSLNRSLSATIVTARGQRPLSYAPLAPPTSFAESSRASPVRHNTINSHTPARSTSPMEVLARTPGRSDPLYTHAPRPSQPMEVGVVPPRKGPLIFAAMASISQPNDSVTITPKSVPASSSRPVVIDAASVPHAYPSPPAEVISLDQKNSERHHQNPSMSGPDARAQTSGLSPSPFEKGVQPPSPPVVPFEPLPPTRVRKLSKTSSGARAPPDHSPRSAASNVKNIVGSESPKPHRVLTKARPVTPSSPQTTSEKLLVEQDPLQGDSLLLDADPFAKAEGVQMVKSVAMSSSRSSSRDEGVMKMSSSSGSLPGRQDPEESTSGNDASGAPGHPRSPPTPVSPDDDYKTARRQRRGQWLEKSLPPLVADVIAKQEYNKDEVAQEEEEIPPRPPSPPKPPTYFPIVSYLSDATLLPLLLACLSFPEWCSLYSANKEIRALFESRILRERVLERYLSTVGYVPWTYEWAEPIALSLKDLDDYMRGVSMPTHQYARFAESYLQPRIVDQDEPSAAPDINILALTTRAYTRVVLRLRAQVESEARYMARLAAAETSPSRPATRNSHRQPVRSRASSRAPSPASSYSHSYSHGAGSHGVRRQVSPSEMVTFRSPLVRLHRAPLLRVFVPSPEGEWLSDQSVMECETELKRAGVMKLLRVGDVVWDIAVGDEGNAGRMIWDGSYLVDLDYKFSRMGELPPYFHNLAFSPSYFHRVLRTGVSGSGGGNPIVYVDLSPWGEELAANLQLLQDRARTETAHGALHNVVRWVHRTSFTIRPPSQLPHSHIHTRSHALRLPIPNVEGFFIDPGWYGTIVVEAEGTNEGLADLQERCGPGAFPPRAEALSSKIRGEKEKTNKRVFRILREKSRPGEIWIRPVSEKERVV